MKKEVVGPQLDADEEFEIKVTVSVGVATADIRDRQGVNLVSRADAALYAAKHAGRNRVEIAGPPVGLPVPAL